MNARIVIELRELADILADGRTVTDSGLPVTVLEEINVQQAAAEELRDIARRLHRAVQRRNADAARRRFFPQITSGRR